MSHKTAAGNTVGTENAKQALKFKAEDRQFRLVDQNWRRSPQKWGKSRTKLSSLESFSSTESGLDVFQTIFKAEFRFSFFCCLLVLSFVFCCFRVFYFCFRLFFRLFLFCFFIFFLFFFCQLSYSRPCWLQVIKEIEYIRFEKRGFSYKEGLWFYHPFSRCLVIAKCRLLVLPHLFKARLDQSWSGSF